MPTKTQKENRANLIRAYRTSKYDGLRINPTRGTYGDLNNIYRNTVDACAEGVIALVFPKVRYENYLDLNFAEWNKTAPSLFGVTLSQAVMFRQRAESLFEGRGDDRKHSFAEIATKLSKFFKMCDAWNAENP